MFNSAAKKTIAIILLCSMLTFAFLAASCGEKNKESDVKDTSATEENSVETDPAEDSVKALVNSYTMPEADFGGNTFTIMIRGQVDEWDNKDIVAEEDSSEAFESAVYNRNVEIEEKYNVDIVAKWVDNGNMIAQLKKSVQTGDGTYDAVMLNFQNASSAAKSNFLHDLNKVPYVDLTKPWWDQSLMAETSVMNKVYYATGEMTIMDNEGTWTMMFNKQMLKDLNLDDPYELVRQGKWTLDKFIEMGKDVSSDLDGDGKMGKDDKYALATTNDTVQGLFFSSGLRIIKKDAQDMPYFALTGENVANNFEKIAEIMRGSHNITQVAGDFGTHVVVQATFEEGRSLFYAEVMQCVIRLRQMETEFGVIPLPKANENQEKYQTYVHNVASSTFAIPSDLDGEELERAGFMIEALTHGGMKYLTPAYYDLALKYKHTRDEESSEMLDIIFAGRSADLGYVDGVGSIMNDMVNQVLNRKNAFTSTIEKKEKAINKDIEKMIKAYDELD